MCTLVTQYDEDNEEVWREYEQDLWCDQEATEDRKKSPWSHDSVWAVATLVSAFTAVRRS